MTGIRPDLPGDLEKIVRRCVTKDPEERLQSAKDLRNELRELKEESKPEVSYRPPRRKQSWRVWGTLGAVTLFLLAAWLVGRRPPEAEVPRFANAVQITSAFGQEKWPSWSPDGSRFAYQSDQAGNWDIWVTEVGSGIPLNRTADFAGGDMFPAWSPDGRQIAFRSDRDGGGIFIMPSLAGPPRRVSRPGADVLGPTNGSPRAQWSSDSAALAYVVWESDSMFIAIASLESGSFRRVALASETGCCSHLSWSPSGRFFAYILRLAQDYSRLVVLDTAGSELHLVTDAFRVLRGPSWSSDGRALYFVANPGGSTDLYRQQLGENGAPDGEPRAVTVGVGINESAAFSPDGMRLAYSKGGRVSNVWRVPILPDRPATWADASQLTLEEAFVEFVDIAPDAGELVVTSYRTGNGEIFILPLDGGEMRQLTDHPALDNDGRWSPDGTEIAFYSNRAGDRDIWIMPASGGPARRLTEGPGEDYGPTWSPDGESIAFERVLDADQGAEIHVVPTRGGAPRRIATEPKRQWWPSWSPDGQWIAYQEPQGGLWRVPSAGGEPELLLEGRGARPRWSPDGQELLYLVAERQGRFDTLRTGSERDSSERRNLWSLVLEDRTERALTRLEGKLGRLGGQNFATDGSYLYFIWEELRADIWVMDVVTE